MRILKFRDIVLLLEGLGFGKRVRGSHYIFVKDGIVEIINLQEKSREAKPIKLKQVRA